jgi:hypothetical protein
MVTPPLFPILYCNFRKCEVKVRKGGLESTHLIVSVNLSLTYVLE